MSKTTNSITPARLYLWTNLEAFENSVPPQFEEARVYDDNQSSTAISSKYRIWYGIDLGEGDDPPFENFRGSGLIFGKFKTINVSGSQTTNTLQLRDVAKAYHQIDDDRILVESSLGLPNIATGELYDIVVRYYDRRSETMREQVLKATHESIATYNSTDVGYYIHINRSFLHQCVSFGDWSQGSRALISRGGRFQNERIGTALFRVIVV